jgi:hypothetical protein
MLTFVVPESHPERSEPFPSDILRSLFCRITQTMRLNARHQCSRHQRLRISFQSPRSIRLLLGKECFSSKRSAELLFNIVYDMLPNRSEIVCCYSQGIHRFRKSVFLLWVSAMTVRSYESGRYNALQRTNSLSTLFCDSRSPRQILSGSRPTTLGFRIDSSSLGIHPQQQKHILAHVALL